MNIPYHIQIISAFGCILRGTGAVLASFTTEKAWENGKVMGIGISWRYHGKLIGSDGIYSNYFAALII